MQEDTYQRNDVYLHFFIEIPYFPSLNTLSCQTGEGIESRLPKGKILIWLFLSAIFT